MWDHYTSTINTIVILVIFLAVLAYLTRFIRRPTIESFTKASCFTNASWSEYIDECIIINLDVHRYKYERILKLLTQYGMPPNKIRRFSAIAHSDNGHLGCGLSHYKVLEECEQSGHGVVMILEDDFSFKVDLPSLNRQFDLLFRDYPKFDVVQLYSCYRYEVIPVTEYLHRVHSAGNTTGYLVQRGVYNRLKQEFKRGIDVMQSHYNAYLQSDRITKYEFNWDGQIDRVWRDKFQKENQCYLLDVGEEFGYESTTNPN